MTKWKTVTICANWQRRCARKECRKGGRTMWIVEQRAPAGDWFVRATVDTREDAEHYARLYKNHNPKIQFRRRQTDDEGEPL